MNSVRVFIATTEGPAEVQRITEEEPNVKSVMCLDGKALALPVSPAYDAFVRTPTGVVEAAYGHPAYRMDVSARISGGMSWQLGVLVAHALFAAGRLAQTCDSASQAVWLTGEVDRDLKVSPVEYVREKIRKSGRLLSELKAVPVPVTLCLPRANYAELDPGWLEEFGIGREGCRIIPVDSADQILDLLGLPSLVASGPQAASARRLRATGRATPVAGAVLTFCGIAVVLGLITWWSGILDPPPWTGGQAIPSAELSITVVELRARPGETCAAVKFGSAEPQLNEIGLANRLRLKTDRAEDLCGLQYRINNPGAEAQVWIFGARSGEGSQYFNTRTLAQDRVVHKGENLSLDIRLPRHMEEGLVHRLAIVAVRDPSGDAQEYLDGVSKDLKSPLLSVQWNLLLDGLEQTGLDVIDVTHELLP